MRNNVLIEASAGTGKTQALAERLIGLLAVGVRPQEIVALTFSRAAAGEIFERFVTLLAQRAGKDPAAARQLRDVIATQHLSQIGTLDGFLMRIVRSFPLELGVLGTPEIMDDYTSRVERGRIAFSILRRTDRRLKRDFFEAFSLAMNREDVRGFADTYRKFVTEWHDLVLDFPNETAWGDPVAIWGEGFDGAVAAEAELSAAADKVLAADHSGKLTDFAEWVRGFNGSFSGLKGIAKKLLESNDVFVGSTVEFDFNRRKYSYGGEAAAAIRRAVSSVVGYALRMKLELARGIYRMVSVFERDYELRVRRYGRLVFADVPRLIGALREDIRLALEYRTDSRIRAWALDEFQDTSREQWRALRGLLGEAKQSDGEKAVFVVGDSKQAIYGWRNGDVSIFRHERDGGEYECGELAKTYRSGPAVVEAVNQVFARGAIAAEFPSWHCPVHQTARPELDGFVQVVECGGSKAEDFVEPVANALRAIEPVARGLSAAVLVRDNATGELIANGLKRSGVAGVVWEGESSVFDTPALSGFLDLVQLSEHPGDLMAWRHFRMTPLAAAKYPDGVPDAVEISREMSLAFTASGLVRVLRELRGLLPEDPAVAWSAATEERFTDMVRAASDFELSAEPGTRLSDFAKFLAGRLKRNLAEPGRIKVMTIHRSKGLGFDYVALPLYEHSPLNATPDGPLVGSGWVLPDPGGRVAKLVGGLDAAFALRSERAEQEALCTYYVAMTRAKRAMTIVLHPKAKTQTAGRRISDFIRQTIPRPIGNPEWYRAFAGATDESGTKAAGGPSVEPKRGPRQALRRSLPSSSFRTGQSAGELFASRASRQAAMANGIGVHGELARIGWIDPASPASDLERKILATPEWREAFVRSGDETVLWRERSYERVVGGVWESGQFDRVVFRGEGIGRSATIYDFKTNARLRGETDAAFSARLRADYSGQMQAYRAALCAITGLSADRVKTHLLATVLMRDG